MFSVYAARGHRIVLEKTLRLALTPLRSAVPVVVVDIFWDALTESQRR